MWSNQWGSEYAGGWLTDGLRHYWSFDSGSYDDKVGSLDFVAGMTQSDGKSDTGFLSENGSGTYAGDGNTLTSEANYPHATVSAWVSPRSNSGDFSNAIWSSSSSQSTGHELYWTKDGSNYRYLAYRNSGTEELVTTSGLTADTYHHAVLTFRDGTAELWVNGVSLGTASTSDTTFNILQWQILRSNGAYDNFSKLDELAIWDRVLSDSEIALLYNGGGGRFYPTFMPPAPTLTYLDSVTLELSTDDIEAGPVITSLDSVTLEVTPDDVEPGEVITALTSSTLEIQPYSIGPHITAGIDSVTLEVTPDDIEPGPVLTSLDSVTLELAPDDVEPGPVTTSLTSATLELDAHDLVVPITTSIDSVTLELTPDDIEPGTVLTSLNSVTLELDAHDLVSPINAAIDSVSLVLTPDDVEPGPMITTLVLSEIETEAGLIVTDLAEPAIGTIIYEIVADSPVPGPMKTSLSATELELPTGTVSAVIANGVLYTQELALLSGRLFGTTYEGVVLSGFVQADAVEE